MRRQVDWRIKNFCALVAEAMNKDGLTLRDLAEASGLPYRYVKDAVDHKIIHDFHTFFKLIDTLEIDVTRIFTKPYPIDYRYSYYHHKYVFFDPAKKTQ